MKKTIFAVVVGSLFLYYGSCLLFGKRLLANYIKRDNHSSYNEYQWTNRINLISNIPFGSNSIQNLKQIVKSQEAEINFIKIENENELKKFTNNEGVYNYLLLTDSSHFPWIKIEECENMEEYVAVWEIKYVWCFFKWIKIKDEMLAIS